MTVPLCAHALDPEVVERLKRGTVLIRTPTGEGSGFFYDEQGVVITNRHVVEDVGEHATVQVVLDSGTRESTTVQGVVLSLSETDDLAIPWGDDQGDRALADAADVTVYETQPVVAVGFPMGSVRSFGDALADPPVSLRPGAVTALHRSSSGRLTCIEHNANMQTGSSGGPLVQNDGRVVGIHVAIMRDDNTTKLSIPVAILDGYLAQLSAQLSQTAPTPPAAPSQARVIRTEIARPFEQGVVRELAVSPTGDDCVRFADGAIRLLRDERLWVDLHSGHNHRGHRSTGRVSDDGSMRRRRPPSIRRRAWGSPRVAGELQRDPRGQIITDHRELLDATETATITMDAAPLRFHLGTEAKLVRYRITAATGSSLVLQIIEDDGNTYESTVAFRSADDILIRDEQGTELHLRRRP